MSKMFRAEKFDFARVSNYSAGSKRSQQLGSKDALVDFVGVEGQVAEDIESFGRDVGFFHAQGDPGLAMSQHRNYQQHHHHHQHLKELSNLDDLYPNVVPPPLQLCEHDMRKRISIEAKNTELTEPKKSGSFLIPSASLEALREYRSRRPKLDGESSNAGHKIQSTHARAQSSLTETTIKLAAEKFIHSMSQNSSELSMLNHPYPSSILAHSEEDSKGVQLVQNLLSCVEKVAEKQYERAIKFLKECDKLSSPTGTPIQRLVFYFSEAIFVKIAMETGRILPKDFETVDSLEMVMIPSMTLQIAFHKDYPLAQIAKLVGIQAVLDHLGEATKVHIIDLQIRSGAQWIILIQALAARSKHPPVQHLKITAIGSKHKSMLEETGKQLASFAQSLNLKFTFKVVLVDDILELNQNLFDLDADESVAVYASYFLTTMVARADRLNHLMRVMRNMGSCVMIVTELEVNCNSPSFTGRFVESLFFFGAFFDSMADCFENNHRINAESTLFRSSIRNVLAAEGEQRTIRHVNINVWRAFFAHFGLVEIELSTSSLDQATLGIQNLPFGSCCTLYRDGKSLTIGWKGTPVSSVSAWKFQRDLCWFQRS